MTFEDFLKLIRFYMMQFKAGRNSRYITEGKATREEFEKLIVVNYDKLAKDFAIENVGSRGGTSLYQYLKKINDYYKGM